MKLKDYLSKNKIRPFDFAYQLGLSHATVYHYLKGTRNPAPSVIVKIDKLTKGVVTWEDFGYETITEIKRVRTRPRDRSDPESKKTA